MAHDARAVLLELLPDGEEVVEYILGILEDAEDDESIDGIVELLSAHISDEIDESKVRAAVKCAAGHLAQGQQMVTQVATKLATTGLEPHKPPAVAPLANADAETVSPCPPTLDEGAAATLQEMVPDASRSLCEHTLRRCGHEVEAALEILLGGELKQLEIQAAQANAARDRALADAAAAERKADRDARRRALERNAMVRDYEADGVAPPPTNPRLPYAATRKEALRGAGTRFLDGQVVSTKGEKHIVISDKPEWDGGSTGKVMTKGKRGKGYV